MERVTPQIDFQSGVRTTETRTVPGAQGDTSRVPYYEVIGEYSRAAEESLEREEVPPTYQRSVRAYFDALQGGGDRKDEKQP